MARITLVTLLASLAALAQAVILTNSEFNVVPGETFTIEWSEASGPVTLRLKTGPSDALVTVQEITSGQSGESFIWNVPTTLETGQYAIEIDDGTAVNYSVQFPLSGDGSAATGASSATASAATTAGTASASASASNSDSATATVTTSAESSASAEITSSASESLSSASSAETESASSSDDDHSSSHSATATSTIITTTRATRPSATETDSDNEPSQVPDSGAAGTTGSALLGAIIGLGALLMAY